MRKRSAEILAQLCASAPKRAVVDALLDVKLLSKSELERLVEELKSSPQVLRPAQTRRGRADGSPAARIQRLLAIEANLPPNQAMAQLRNELTKTTRASLPPTMDSLERWLKALLEAVPAGEVLNAAMTIARRVKP